RFTDWMSGFWRSLGNRLFARLSLAFACCLIVSFALAAALTVLPLKRSIAREAQNELHATADRTLGQIDRFVDARCDDLRLWGSLLPASPAPPAGRAALERYLARVSAASRQPWRLLALVDRDGTILASSAPGPRAGEVEGDPGPVQGGHSECGVAFRAGA